MNRLFRSGRVVYRQLTQSSLLCQRTLLLPCERRPLGLPTTIRLFSAVADDSWEEYKKEDSVIWKETFEELKNHLNDLKKERGLSESDPTPYPEQLNLKNWVSRLRVSSFLLLVRVTVSKTIFHSTRKIIQGLTSIHIYTHIWSLLPSSDVLQDESLWK